MTRPTFMPVPSIPVGHCHGGPLNDQQFLGAIGKRVRFPGDEKYSGRYVFRGRVGHHVHFAWETV